VPISLYIALMFSCDNPVIAPRRRERSGPSRARRDPVPIPDSGRGAGRAQSAIRTPRRSLKDGSIRGPADRGVSL
jgi:hypothetical protein